VKVKLSELEQQMDGKVREMREVKSRLQEAESREKATVLMSEEYQRLVKVRTGELQERND
jgi:hypothetical protein